MAEINEEFGRRIRQLLGERRLSYRQAFWLTGVHYNQVSDMAHGVVPRDTRVLERFLKPFDMDADDFLPSEARRIAY